MTKSGDLYYGDYFSQIQYQEKKLIYFFIPKRESPKLTGTTQNYRNLNFLPRKCLGSPLSIHGPDYKFSLPTLPTFKSEKVKMKVVIQEGLSRTISYNQLFRQE